MVSRDTQYISISTSTILRFVGIVLALVAIYQILDIVSALFFAVIVASAIEPSIEWLKKKGFSRIFAVILIYLVFGGILSFAVYLILPLLVEELHLAASMYSTLQGQITKGLERIVGGGFGSMFPGIDGTSLIPSDYLQRFGNGIFGFAAQVFGGVFSFILVIVFSFYLAAQEKGIETFLRMVTPLRFEPYVVDLWNRSQRKLGRWLRGQLILGAMIGVFIFIGLTMLGIEQALLFALLAALFEIIPVVGPILAGVPAVVAAFLISPLLGLSVVALYVIVQQMESHVIIPVVMRRTVGLSPLIVVIALLVGAKLGGIFGTLLSVPIAVILAEFIGDWDRKKRELIPE